MKKLFFRTLSWLATFAILFVSFGQARSSAASAPELSLAVGCDPCGSDAPLSVQVQVKNAVDLGAFEFELTYDPIFFSSVQSVTPSSLMGVVANCNAAAQRCAVALGPQNGSGLAAVGAYTYGAGGGSQDGEAATLVLQPKGVGGATTLHITQALVSDTAGNVTVPGTTDLTVNLTGGAPVKLFLPAIRR